MKSHKESGRNYGNREGEIFSTVKNPEAQKVIVIVIKKHGINSDKIC